MPLHLAWIIWCPWNTGNPSLREEHESVVAKIMAIELKKNPRMVLR